MPQTDDWTTEEISRFVRQLNALYDYLGDRALYTKDVIEYNGKQLGLLTNEKHECELKGYDRGSPSKMSPFRAFFEKYAIEETTITFFDYTDCASRFTPGAYDTELQEHLAAFSKLLLATIYMSIIPSPQLAPPPDQSDKPKKDLVSSAEKWEESKIRNKFTDSLSLAWNSWSLPNDIKNIVCFGLAPLHIDSAEYGPDELNPDTQCLNRYRTLLAFDVAWLLKFRFNTTVPLVFHQSGYWLQDQECMKDLATDWGLDISFLGVCQTLLQVNENTLVLAHGHESLMPIRQIIVDITRKDGGPAGFLCEDIPEINTIEEEVIEFTKHPRSDPPTKRVSEMAKKYDMDEVCRIDKWKATMYLKRHAIKDPPTES